MSEEGIDVFQFFWDEYNASFLSCLMVNVFPGNASFSCCFVTLKSVCGLRLYRMIGVIFLSFVLCVWVVECWLVW